MITQPKADRILQAALPLCLHEEFPGKEYSPALVCVPQSLIASWKITEGELMAFSAYSGTDTLGDGTPVHVFERALLEQFSRAGWVMGEQKKREIREERTL